ncbi:hypothetical protein [Burkholderia multivorans]|uniref:hypothetical protein n=1 Tax=Burkholderia multivorans TaxID=87883 RepID=UPI0002FE622B
MARRSPASCRRAIACLEAHTGTARLYRTTRTIRLGETGERHAAACLRLLADFEEAGMSLADERSAPVTVTAPVAFSEDIPRALRAGCAIARSPARDVR